MTTQLIINGGPQGGVWPTGIGAPLLGSLGAGLLYVDSNSVLQQDTSIVPDGSGNFTVAGSITFTKEVNHSLTVAASTTTNTAGGNLSVTAGAGSPADGVNNGGTGGTAAETGGAGGAASATQTGGTGGPATLTGGAGGAASAAQAAGTGGGITIQSGAGGSNALGGGGGASGNVTIDTGAATGAATNGTMSIGATNANAITLGRAGKTITVAGSPALTGGFLDITEIVAPANPAASIIRLYAKQDGTLAFRTSAGVEHVVNTTP